MSSDSLAKIPVQELAKIILTQFAQIRAQVAQIQTQAEQISTMQKTIDELKDEISRLNNTPKRPKFRSGGMEPRDRSKKDKPNNSSDACNLTQAQDNPKKEKEEKRIPPDNIPKRSRFKGDQTFTVQELELHVKETTYKLEVWEAPDGTIHRGKLPEKLQGLHFGPELRAVIINLYAQCMTQPCILEFPHGIEIEISSGQVHNILMNESESFSGMAEKILSAGLKEAEYIETDDTRAKHRNKNGYCTYLGGQHFSYYKSTQSKSRENFLNILLQGKEGYHVNDAMLWHLSQCGVKDHVLNLFEECKGKKYTSKQGFQRLLKDLSIQGKKLTEQSLEAGRIGFISETILKEDQVLLSDRAGQFSILNHAGCWVHMERPLRKIPVTNSVIEEDLKGLRSVIWETYRKLKEAVVNGIGREEVESLYDKIVSTTSLSPQITEVVRNFRDYREELFKALDYPTVPLHNIGEQLIAYCKEKGFTHVQIEDLLDYINPLHSGSCWNFFTPSYRLGTIHQLQEMIDRLHKEGIGVIMRMPFSDFDPVEFGLSSFDGHPLFDEEKEGHGKFSLSNRFVRDYLASALDFWTDVMHIDGFVFDTDRVITSEKPYESVRKNSLGRYDYPSGVRFIQDMATFVREKHKGVLLIAEGDLLIESCDVDYRVTTKAGLSDGPKTLCTLDHVKPEAKEDAAKIDYFKMQLCRMFFLPGIKCTSMGEEFGQPVSWKERLELAHTNRFETSVDWETGTKEPYVSIGRLTQALHTFYNSHPALSPPAEMKLHATPEEGVSCFERSDKDKTESLLCFSNDGPEAKKLTLIEGLSLEGYKLCFTSKGDASFIPSEEDATTLGTIAARSMLVFHKSLSD